MNKNEAKLENYRAQYSSDPFCNFLLLIKFFPYLFFFVFVLSLYDMYDNRTKSKSKMNLETDLNQLE